MSNVTTIVKQQNVKEMFDKHLISIPLVPKKDFIPSTGQYAFEGTCFDYCLRFIIAKEFHDKIAIHNALRWIATSGLLALPENEKIKWLPYVVKAKQVIADFIEGKENDLFKIATISQYLSNLDNFFRSGRYNPYFKHNDTINKMLIELIDRIPISQFKEQNPKEIHLNPVLSIPTLNADADIILGNTLIDIKTVKDNSFTKSHLYQLGAYYALITKTKDIKIDNIAIYFSRHGQLMNYPIHDVFENPESMATNFMKLANHKNTNFSYNY